MSLEYKEKMKEIKKYIDKKLTRNKEKLKELKEKHGDNPGITHTYWGGEEYGYLKGKITAFENVLDEMEENPVKEYYVETPFINFTMFVSEIFPNNDPKYKVLCLFKINEKEHKYETEVTYSDINDISSIKKNAFLKIVFERMSRKVFYELLNNYNLEEIRI